MASQLKRIERLEEAFRRSSLSRQSPDCICFPADEMPHFLYAPVYGIAAAVLCPIHGYRFPYSVSIPLFICDSRREVEVGMRWPNAAEQFRKAWNASFPPGSWPVEEVEIAGRKWLLPRGENGELVDYVTAQTGPPWKRVKTYTEEEVLRITNEKERFEPED